MECEKHHKRAESSCRWCGSALCRLCWAKRLGAQHYCEECAKSLGEAIERRQIVRMREVRHDDE